MARAAYRKRRVTATEEDVEKQRAMSRDWKARNKAKLKADRAAYYAVNKEREKANNQRWIAEHPEEFKALKAASDRAYREANAEALKAKRSSPEGRAKSRERSMTRYYADPQYRLKCILRAVFLQALRLQGVPKKRSVLPLIGCSIEVLIAHLERQFLPGMSWANHSQKGWHIDHRIPCAFFDLTDPEQQRRCFHYTNLQPLWATENQSKGARQLG